MPRAPGEHKKDFAARQLAASLPAPRPQSVTMVIPPVCRCGFRPWPHFPSEFPDWVRRKHESWTPDAEK